MSKVFVVSDGAGCGEYELLGIYSSFNNAIESCKNIFIEGLPHSGNCLRVEEWCTDSLVDHNGFPIIYDMDEYYRAWVNDALKSHHFKERDISIMNKEYFKEVNEE